MELLERIRYALRTLLKRGRAERELDEELRFHLERQAEAYERAGMSAAAARTAAARDFGGLERHKEDCRDARGTGALEALWRDLRHAARGLRRTPGASVLVVGVLALGVGANTAIFSVVNGVLLRPLPYADARRLVVLFESDRDSGTDSEAASVPDFFDFRSRNHVFSSLAGYYTQSMNLVVPGAQAQRVEAALATHDLFSTLGISPQVGRVFGAAEDRPGGELVAVISDRLWRRQFAAAADVVGHPLALDGRTYSVVGVLPRHVAIPTRDTDVWLPLQFTATSAERARHMLSMVARLRPGVSLERASDEMAAIMAQLEREYPVNADRGVRLAALSDQLLGQVRPAIVVLFSAVALVLLIACANAANLLLARALVRRRETAIRTALGASPAHVARLHLAEGTILAGLAAVVGLLLAHAGVASLRALAPADLPRLDEVRVDPVVLLYALAVTAAVTIAFGLLPVLWHRRMDVHGALRSEGGRLAGTTPAQRRLRESLVVGEVALSVVLLVGATLLLRSFWTLSHVDPGFRPDGMLKASYQLPESRYPHDFARYPAWTEIQRFDREVEDRLRALPGVRSVALAWNDPLNPGFTNSFVIVGREAEAAHQAEIYIRPVSPSYFATAGVALRRGRLLEPRDDDKAPPVALLNEAAVRRYFPDTDPLGQELRWWGVTRRIVGIVADERFMGLAAETPQAVYTSLYQMPSWTGTTLLRVAGDPSRLEPLVRQAVAQVDPGVALFDVESMRDAVDESVAQPRFTAALLGGFAVVALLLALAGIHGLLSYLVTQRTHEIGVRIALGAAPGAVVRQVTGYGLGLAAAGLAMGVVGALGAGRLLRSLLFSVGATDPATFAVVAAGVMAVAALASCLPARRVVGIDPVTALRAD